MEISIINIGNSKGIRLSKALLDRYNFGETVEMILEKGYIMTLSAKHYPARLKVENGDKTGWVVVDQIY
jgi:antitoxin component of MazEF toxin-antitoxin module